MKAQGHVQQHNKSKIIQIQGKESAAPTTRMRRFFIRHKRSNSLEFQ